MLYGRGGWKLENGFSAKPYLKSCQRQDKFAV